VALSLVLLISAGLFIQSLKNMKDLKPGFETKNLLTFSVEPTLSGQKAERSLQYFRQLMEQLKGLPGVTSAAVAVIPLLTGDEWDNWMTVEGYTAKQGEIPDVYMQFVSPGFFETLKIPILMGRDFTIKDEKGAPKVGIVNQKMVKRYFGSTNPIGRHLGMGIDPGTKLDIEIVGVAGDTKYESMRAEVPYELYVPYVQQEFVLGMTAYVRTRGDPANLFSTVRQTVRNVDASVPIYDMRTLEQQTEVSLVTERLMATLSTVFGALATLLASMGLYGVMAYMVARRTREIGIRIALGAGRSSVLWLVMREVLLLAAIGLGIGLGSAWGLTRLVEAQLFGIKPFDALTMALATIGIASVAMLAGYLPARRASGVDPMHALRFE
jgi:predicted permease